MEGSSRGRPRFHKAPALVGFDKELLDWRPQLPEVGDVVRFPLRMNEATFEADLDLCDVRTLYRQNRTSTPTRDKVCSNENLDCKVDHFNSTDD